MSVSWFEDFPDEFEESMRIDREGEDHRTQAIDTYHLTADSRRFVREFIARMLGQADDMRAGPNYWLYGYYGSGKSHLLTVLEGLLDSDWLEGQHASIWEDLVPTLNVDDELYDSWRTLHEERHVIPVSINLLKYQDQKQRSFSEIVLGHSHRNPALTGVDDEISRGLSSQLEVAFFESWYRTKDEWHDRGAHAEAALASVTTEASHHDWQSDSPWTAVQNYGALADVVLPRLFEEVNGTRDGYSDLQPSEIDPAGTVSRLERLRSQREKALGEPITLVLLLDEVSLFVGTEFERLTELQTLAESVEEIGDGSIQLVVTAQAKIEDVQPTFAAHGADFSIVKDRFPHRYQLPSKHVGEIAKRRLFEKSDLGETEVRTLLEEASVKPTESLIYNGIKQNTKPSLDSIDRSELVECYPFLPYHAPLFLEILSNLRGEASDPAKSIFSGTARAILALMHSLLNDWIEENENDRIITLVEFYELIKPELNEIVPQETRVIEGTETTLAGKEHSPGIAPEVENGDLEEFDLTVAKAVLLLGHVHENIPLDPGNIACAVMDDLNGPSWISTQNRVEESLDRLGKYIRPTAEDKPGARYRFATREERAIYEMTERNEANPDWDAILETMDEHLWKRIAEDLQLPESVPYGEQGEEYPVTYGFGLDDTAFETSVNPDGDLGISIEVQGIRPEYTPETGDETTLYWSTGTDGLDDLRRNIVEWWALQDAVSNHTEPNAVERDRKQRAKAVRRKLTSAMRNGSYTVKDRTDIRGLAEAVETAVEVTYSDDYHPEMGRVTEDRLAALKGLSPNDPLPVWAHTIQVPSLDRSESRGRKTIQTTVRGLTGRQLKGRSNGLNMNTVLDGIISQKPYYENAGPALRAILWGYCRRGLFVPLEEDGTTLAEDAVLDRSRLSTTRLKLLQVDQLGSTLKTYGFKETTETVAVGLKNLQETNKRLRSRLIDLREDIELLIESDLRSDAITGLLSGFSGELDERVDAATKRQTVFRSQGDGMDEAIKGTKAGQEWFEEVSDIWEHRRVDLYRFDAELTAGATRFEWVGEDLGSVFTEQRTALKSFDGSWWTRDGWRKLMDVVKLDISEELQRSWTEYVDERKILDFVERIDANPWIVSAMELPGGVGRSFEREYITPLRSAQGWYETIEKVMMSLTSDDEETLRNAAAEIATVNPYGDATEYDIEELAARLDRLEGIVGNRTPDDVDRIGVLPDDRRAIDKRLVRLVETRELNTATTSSGVIIR